MGENKENFTLGQNATNSVNGVMELQCHHIATIPLFPKSCQCMLKLADTL